MQVPARSNNQTPPADTDRILHEVDRNHAIMVAMCLITAVKAVINDPLILEQYDLESLRDWVRKGQFRAEASGTAILGDWSMLHKAACRLCAAAPGDQGDKWRPIVSGLLDLVEGDLARLRGDK